MYGIQGEYKKVLENEIFMRLALEQAKIAGAKGEFPVGCVIVQAGEVVGTGARKGTRSGHLFFSEIDHAEIRALKSQIGRAHV